MVRVTQKQKPLSEGTVAFQLIFSIGGSLRPFERSSRRRSSRGPLAHKFMRLINFLNEKRMKTLSTYCQINRHIYSLTHSFFTSTEIVTQAHTLQTFGRSNKQEKISTVDHNIFTLKDRVNFSACIEKHSTVISSHRKEKQKKTIFIFIIAIDQQKMYISSACLC